GPALAGEGREGVGAMPGWFGFPGFGVLAALMAAPAQTAQPREAPAAEQSGPGERARRLLDEALLAAKELESRGVAAADEIVARFRAAAEASPRAAAVWFDLAVALEKAGKLADAAQAWRAAAQ